MATVFTVGHSNKSADDFVELLSCAGITVLVDVRTYPRSKYNPQFNMTALQMTLERAGIRYVFKGKNLGGLAGNVRYDETLDEIVAAAERDQIALMCSEGDIKKCHRKTMLTPDLLRRGAQVVHIMWNAELITEDPTSVNDGLFVPEPALAPVSQGRFY